MKQIPVKRTGTVLKPDSGRVMIRPFLLGNRERVRTIIERVMALNEKQVHTALALALEEFAERHLDIDEILLRHARQASSIVPNTGERSRERELLIGTYFTSEYALESAALFNPSIVPAPEQSGVGKGELRFILSLRATGEGHISSIEFRSGTLDPDGVPEVDPVTAYVSEPVRIEAASYELALFRRKLEELSLDNTTSRQILVRLGETFTLQDLDAAIRWSRRGRDRDSQRTVDGMRLLAESNYETAFKPGRPVCERIIFPSSPSESNGIEDARFVAFREDDGSVVYYATYTAYDGKVILPQLIETSDFLHFKISTLNGPAAQNKGMALFPRRVNGLYAMISRQDNENLYLMLSDNIHFWYDPLPLMMPREPWEIVQLGNCGSPIETEAGWLVLTHGVGPMRKYCIGAILLDLEDPSRVLGRLRDPLLTPVQNERIGYVPNVVYTCGALVHNGVLVLPYAMSDYATGFATVGMDALLDRLKSEPVA
jgi:predicted GH43/DUF377 family glycosyl hydrolase